jgi:hypothetical protein
MSSAQKKLATRPKRQDALDRRIRRRRKFIEETIQKVAPSVFSAGEAIDLVAGRPIDAKRAVRRAARRALPCFSESQFFSRPVQLKNDRSLARRPVRTLSRLNGSSVFPPLVPAEIEIKAIPLHEILRELRSHYGESPPHRLLDALATASGFSWESCGQILYNQKLVGTPIDLHDLAATQAARSFWNKYGQGRARYLNLIMLGRAPQLQGDWAYFEDTQLESLLPGITIPGKLKREHYLANYLAESDCSSLDVYAGNNLTPLFKHRFLPQFNPLFFGKPRHQPKSLVVSLNA